MPDLVSILQRAKAGDPDAQFNAGNVYHGGLLGQARNLREAQRWYERAAHSGHVDSMTNLALLFLQDLPREGGTKDVVRGREWFERAAAQGDIDAMFQLGRLHLREEEILDQDIAMCWLEKAADDGHDDALLEFALQILGRGTDQDAKEAARLLAQGADRGHAPSRTMLGVVQMNGEGVPQDEAAGFGCFVEAADQGDARAMYEAAQCLRRGRGTEQDLDRAFELYCKAGEQDHALSLFSAALMLEDGLGFERPFPERAEPLYQLAAMHGHSGAAHALGKLFAKGLGVDQDLRAAEELFAFAIGRGEDSAMYSAGLLQTILPDGDLVAAAMWGLLAQEHDPDGQGHLLVERLGQRLDEAQQASARRRAEDWVREERTVAWMTKRAA
jgi:TPR repeat protein